MLDAVGPAQISARLTALDKRYDQERGRAQTQQRAQVVEAEVIEDLFTSRRQSRLSTELSAPQSPEKQIAAAPFSIAPLTYGPDAVPRFTRSTPAGKLVSVIV